jgi:hypothetical protein
LNPLHRYREAQRRARALFDPFTEVHCAACATPCCRKPARILPVDLILVEELGFRVHAAASMSAREETRPDPLCSLVDAALGPAPAADADTADEPCDYLGERGCLFPPDLRPFGCVAFICEPMRRTLVPEELARVESAVAELAAAHAELMAELHQ